MEQKNWKDLLSSATATGGVFAFSGIMFLLYNQSKYRLFMLTGIFLMMLAAVNLILLVFARSVTEEPPAVEEDCEDPDTAEVIEEASAPQDGQADDCNDKNKKKKLLGIFKKCGDATSDLICRIYRPLTVSLLAISLVVCFVWFGKSTWLPLTATPLPYWYLAVVGILFVAAVVGDNLCKHSEAEDTRHAMLIRNACIFFKLFKVALVLLALTLTLSMLKLFELELYVSYAIAALFYYVGAMIGISLAVRVFRRELESAPGIVVLLPFMGADVKELSIVSFLEENTGITLRSLWSIKYVKKILPYTLLFAALMFWVSTGIVYVQSHQEAAVFRFGVLQEETLSPGLHLTMPYPIDRTEVYDTATVNKITIGYRSSENVDNVWTENHGKSEFRLLMGSGKELVSINLRLEYKISDLRRYLSFSSAPEKILEAKAYELVTEKTISTDLESILATNRESFSKDFFNELQSELKKMNTGVEVVSVVLESIHPPVEVANIYQKFIAAEIDAERYIFEAQGDAAQMIAAAETTSHELINYANIYYYQSIAAAKNEISEFMAAVNAANEYPDEYKYYKYLEAICQAYKNSKLIIVSDDVDSSRLHFVGNIYVKN